jgi:UDP-N-acetylglucosamine:LPS N-acetylglucosamine transferase
MANGLLSFVASRVSLAFRDAKLPCMKRAIYTGHPIRKELRSIVKVFPDSPKHILIMGGSQGAKSIDGAAARLAEYAKTQALEIVHQVRPENVELVASTYVALVLAQSWKLRHWVFPQFLCRIHMRKGIIKQQTLAR